MEIKRGALKLWLSGVVLVLAHAIGPIDAAVPPPYAYPQAGKEKANSDHKDLKVTFVIGADGQGDDFVEVGGEVTVKATLHARPGTQVDVTFSVEPADPARASLDSTSETMTAGQQVELTLTGGPSHSSSKNDTKVVASVGGKDVGEDKFTVCQIESVVWEQIESELDDNVHPSGAVGLRIFPGGSAPGSGWRDTVRVVVTVAPAIEGVPVYVGWRDPDDPSAPTLAGSEVIDGDTVGGDNKEESCHLTVTGTETDSSGKVEGEFRVGRSAGNNYRIVAAVRFGRLAAVTHENVPATDAPTMDGFVGKLSALLTVWRKVHVEFNSMDHPPADEPFLSYARTLDRIPWGHVVEWTQPVNDVWRDGSLNGAVLRPNSTVVGGNWVPNSNWVVSSNVHTVGGGAGIASCWIYVDVNYTSDTFDNDGDGVGDGAAVDPNEWYNMPTTSSAQSFAVDTDDDEWRGSGANVVLPPETQTAIGWLNGYFKAAYIKCVPVDTSYVVPFCRNTEDTTVPGAHSVSCSQSYVAAWVVWCYEAHTSKLDVSTVPSGLCSTHQRRFYWGDDDPEDEATPSAAWARGFISGRWNGGHRWANVYLETIRDRGASASVGESLAHEIGHSLGLEHALYDERNDPQRRGIMSFDKSESMCLHDYAQEGATYSTDGRFSYHDINELRRNLSSTN